MLPSLIKKTRKKILFHDRLAGPAKDENRGSLQMVLIPRVSEQSTQRRADMLGWPGSLGCPQPGSTCDSQEGLSHLSELCSGVPGTPLPELPAGLSLLWILNVEAAGQLLPAAQASLNLGPSEQPHHSRLLLGKRLPWAAHL